MKWELDAARASAAQAVEHYETARYTTLVNASELGMKTSKFFALANFGTGL